MWRAVVLVVVVLAGCSSESGAGSAAPTPSAGPLTASYAFDLRSSCGERSGLGHFRVTVTDGDVTDVRPLGDSALHGLGPADFPSIDDLEAMVEDAEPGADVEVRRDDHGMLTSLSIDHLPDAINDEECYEVSRFEPSA